MKGEPAKKRRRAQPPTAEERAPVEEPAGGMRAVATNVGVYLLYLLVALVFTYPLPVRLASSVISADSPDIWIHLWWMWQVREALLHGRNPFETARVFHPTGAPLYLMGQDLVTAVASIPLQGILGLVASYNLLTLVAVPFGAWAAYLLALEVTGSRAGALAAGAIFGFAPLQSALLNLGQMEYVNIGFLPLAVCYVLRLHRRWRPATLALGGVCAALTLYSSWYQGLFLALFVGWYALYSLVSIAWRKDWDALAPLVFRLGAWGALTLLLVSPILLPTIRLAAGSSFAVTARENIAYSSIAPLDPFLPTFLNPLWGARRDSLTSSLGYVALALALLGLWRVRGRGRFWLLTILVFYSLALGPFLKLGGRQIDSPLLPYNVLYQLPFGNIARVPTRFLILVTMALAILASWGVGWLAARVAALRPRRARGGRIAVVVVLTLALLAEVFPAPRQTASAALDPFYATLAALPAGAVYELPYDDRALAMYRATAHDHPLVGGYVSRPVPYPLLNGVPVIADLRGRARTMLQDLAGPDIIEQTPPIDQAVAILDTYDIRYVILRRDASIGPGAVAELEADLARLLPAEAIVYDQGPLLVYRIPAGAHSGVVAGFGEGWYAIERRADTGERFRWTDGDALVPLTVLDGGPRAATLTGTIFSYSRPATVDVFLNDHPLTTLTVGTAPQTFSLSLPLGAGYNGLRFRAREGAVTPQAVANVKDTRPLSFGMLGLRLTGP